MHLIGASAVDFFRRVISIRARFRLAEVIWTNIIPFVQNG